MVADVDQDNFEDQVLKSKTPVVIDFWASWCQPCKIFSPIIDEIAKHYDGKAKFVKMNMDENQELASTYSIMSIPAVLLFENGEVKAMSVGAVPKAEFKEWLDSNL